MNELVNSRAGKAGTLVLVLLALYILTLTIGEVKAYKFIGGGVPTSNTITVSGSGEVQAPADIANFTFSVNEEAKTVKDAQEQASRIMNQALAILDDFDVEDKDVKTSGYNVYPQYEWVREICPVGHNCGGSQELKGYQVNQSVTVRVRDLDEAGEILAAIGDAGVSNISGLSFTIDDQDELEREARKEAIDDAETKAKELARDLGVTLVRVVSFNESGGGYYPKTMSTRAFSMDAMAVEEALIAPELPVGENTVSSNVSITYEIR